jgi:hypothetical protein
LAPASAFGTMSVQLPALTSTTNSRQGLTMMSQPAYVWAVLAHTAVGCPYYPCYPCCHYYYDDDPYDPCDP